jgi:glucokinase
MVAKPRMSPPLFAGVDLGGTTINLAIATASGELLQTRTIATDSHEGPKAVLDRMAAAILNFGVDVEAVGVGVPGLVDFATGCTKFLPNLSTQWRDVPVSATLNARLNAPVYLLNDARAAALGELTYGAGRGARTMLLFTLGTGIGGGVVIEGRLHLGPLGGAGELGHQTIVPDGPLCGCGNYGCLEAVASAPALTAEGVRVMRAGLAPHLHELVSGDASRITPREMALSNDLAVVQAIRRVATYLGMGVANMVTALHPDLVVFGGGMAALGDRLIDPVREEVQRRVRMFPVTDLRIERSTLEDRAGLLGAVALAAQKGFQQWTTATNKSQR